jgi:hypothetical protein
MGGSEREGEKREKSEWQSERERERTMNRQADRRRVD